MEEGEDNQFKVIPDRLIIPRFPDEEPEVMDEEEIEKKIELNREKVFQTYVGKNKAFRRNWPKKLTFKVPNAYSYHYDYTLRTEDYVVYATSMINGQGVLCLSGSLVFFLKKSATQRYLTSKVKKPHNSRQIAMGESVDSALKILGFDEDEVFE